MSRATSIKTQRGQMIVLLWSFKRIVDLYPNALPECRFVDYRKAVEDEEYRRYLCSQGRTANHPKLQKLAKALSRLDPRGPLVESKPAERVMSKVAGLWCSLKQQIIKRPRPLLVND